VVALILLSGCALAVAAAGGSALLGLYPLLPSDLGGVRNLDRKARRERIPVGTDDWIDGWYLSGTRPAVVIIFHGYGRNHHRAWRYATFLGAAGFAILAVDFRSSRYRERKPTTLGHFELEDARAALDWVRREPGLEGHRIALLGESLGGSVSLMLAAESPDVAAVVVDAAFSHGFQALGDSCERWARVPRWPSAELLRALGRLATGHDPGAVDVLSRVALLADRPVFFIHGMDDNRFSPEQARELWRAAGSKDPLWLIPGVGHNQGWLRHRRLYERRVTAFLERHLLGAGEGVPAGAI